VACGVDDGESVEVANATIINLPHRQDEFDGPSGGWMGKRDRV